MSTNTVTRKRPKIEKSNFDVKSKKVQKEKKKYFTQTHLTKQKKNSLPSLPKKKKKKK